MPVDPSVYGPGSLPDVDNASGAANVMPGGSGGGKTTPLDGLPYVYGSSKTHASLAILVL